MYFKAPFTCIVVGATGSGKTQLVKKLISHRADIINPPPKTVLYCYGELNETVLEHKQKGIEIYNGIPDVDLIKSFPKPFY